MEEKAPRARRECMTRFVLLALAMVVLALALLGWGLSLLRFALEQSRRLGRALAPQSGLLAVKSG